ncbi:MAG TPA: tetratricopeptide repeat protein [Polyangia bacterium]
MKCALCKRSKGKRGCKLTSGLLICPSCCASTRHAACDGCEHYGDSLAYQREKQIRNKAFTTRIIPELDERCDEALIFVERGDVAKGLALLEGLETEYPNYHMVLFGLGVCNALKGQTDEAIRLLERAVEIFPLLARGHFNLGSAYLQKHDMEKAVKAFETVIEVDGERGEVGEQARARLDELENIVRQHGVDLRTYLSNRRVFDRAFAALQGKQFQAAIDLFGQILATDRRHVQSHGNMGLAYAALGNKQKALECLNAALELEPDYEPAIINRMAVERQKDGEAAPDMAIQEVAYYSQFKLAGRSALKELAEAMEAETKGLLGPTGVDVGPKQVEENGQTKG